MKIERLLRISFLAAAAALNVPYSIATADVSIIDTTASLRGLPTSSFVKQTISGHEWLATPNFAFLIHNKAQNRRVLFDLGLRRDYWNASLAIRESLSTSQIDVAVEKDVRQILEEHQIDVAEIEAVVWSHHHFDHTGDMSTLPESTHLVVGPGFKKAVLPGYPKAHDSLILESDYEGRRVREISFEPWGPRVGNFQAYDYFDDGSFFLLEAPGHTVDHLCGFVRVTSNPDSYVFLAGDAVHHAGEIRPSRHMPLPTYLRPHPFTFSGEGVLSGDTFHPLLRYDDDGNIGWLPFYEPATHGHDPTYDPYAAAQTIAHIQELDQFENIFVLFAHDEHLRSTVPFFPDTINDFHEKGWVPRLRWLFLRDFAHAVGWTGEIPGVRNWSAPAIHE
jgi:glyoxylase-like metal-dependent hydrolase (beta-lactamase superfamily II)